MSRTVHYKGKIRKLGLKDEALHAFAEEFLIKKDQTFSEDEDCVETLLDEYYKEFITINDEVYEVLNINEFDPDDDFVLVNRNEDGTIDFDVKFYNGGACMEEAIEAGLKRLDKK